MQRDEALGDVDIGVGQNVVGGAIALIGEDHAGPQLAPQMAQKASERGVVPFRVPLLERYQRLRMHTFGGRRIEKDAVVADGAQPCGDRRRPLLGVLARGRVVIERVRIDGA